MRLFDRIFDVFSRRADSESNPALNIPETTRNRIIIWCGEVFSNNRSDYGSGDYRENFWQEIHRFLQYRCGRARLSAPGNSPSIHFEDVLAFLLECDGKDFLDFCEYIFRVDCIFHVSLNENQMVDELNELLRVDNLPLHFTNFIKETVHEVTNEPLLGSQERTFIKTIGYPKVIMRESEIIHTQAVEPVLTLLQRPAFRNANSEYLEALEDYRKGDFGDCLTKCGSSFESVMKILCDQKGWPYSQNDTSSTLVKTILAHTQLENYFEQLLIIVATLRNKLSKSHGAGTVSKNVPRHIAQYALNATASAILLLVEEARE